VVVIYQEIFFAMSSKTAIESSRQRTLGQHRLRRRLGGQSLRRAVRHAVRSRFGFTHRAREGESLWSGREHVWLGRATFLHWSMYDALIDIPWLVGLARGVRGTDDERQDAIRSELLAVWKERLAALPSKSTPTWLSLP
jgi:hypothetical protein